MSQETAPGHSRFRNARLGCWPFCWPSALTHQLSHAPGINWGALGSRLGRDNRDNQPLAHCQIHGHVSATGTPPSSCCRLGMLHTAIPGAGSVRPAQRSSGMSCVFYGAAQTLLSVPWSRRWLRITPGCGTGVPSAPKASHSSTITPWE